MKNCFMFGHHDIPMELRERIECVVEQLYLDYDVSIIYVGSYGAFDHIAGAVVRTAKARFSEMRSYLLIPYHPAVRPVVLSEGYDGSYYPPLEKFLRNMRLLKQISI